MPWYYQLIIISTLILFLVVGAVSWHRKEVQIAVQIAVQKNTLSINAEYTKRLNDLNKEQQLNQEILDKKVQATLKEKQNALQVSTNKYNDLLRWVQSQPFRTNGSTSESNIPKDTSNPESTRGISLSGLLQQDAINLVEYAKRTEELKVYLVACYRQYDDVKGTVDAFVLKHNKETSNLPTEKP